MAGGESEQWLVLQPYGGHLEILIHPTSRVLKAECGHYCWLSPQGESYVARGLKTVCLTCSDEAGPGQKATLVKGSLDAVRELGGDRALEAGRVFMRQRGIEGEAE